MRCMGMENKHFFSLRKRYYHESSLILLLLLVFYLPVAIQGVQIFNSMSRKHHVEPDAKHYSCVVNIYSRAGRLDEAYEFIQRMLIGPTAIDWKALLGGCRVYKRVELAENFS